MDLFIFGKSRFLVYHWPQKKLEILVSTVNVYLMPCFIFIQMSPLIYDRYNWDNTLSLPHLTFSRAPSCLIFFWLRYNFFPEMAPRTGSRTEGRLDDQSNRFRLIVCFTLSNISNKKVQSIWSRSIRLQCWTALCFQKYAVRYWTALSDKYCRS